MTELKIEQFVTPEHFEILFSNGVRLNNVKEFSLFDDRIELVKLNGEPEIRKLTEMYHILEIKRIPVNVTYYSNFWGVSNE